MSDTVSALNQQWPMEPTLENFQAQAEYLNTFLRVEAEKNPSNVCKSIQEYVETFYWSGTAQMHARMQLSQSGYHALASLEGIQWLRETYPPA